jgi:hypothetical protein
LHTKKEAISEEEIVNTESTLIKIFSGSNKILIKAIVCDL